MPGLNSGSYARRYWGEGANAKTYLVRIPQPDLVRDFLYAYFGKIDVIGDREGLIKALQLVLLNLQYQSKDGSKLEAIAILENALALQANRGGAIKLEIKKAIALLQC